MLRMVFRDQPQAGKADKRLRRYSPRPRANQAGSCSQWRLWLCMFAWADVSFQESGQSPSVSAVEITHLAGTLEAIAVAPLQVLPRQTARILQRLPSWLLRWHPAHHHDSKSARSRRGFFCSDSSSSHQSSSSDELRARPARSKSDWEKMSSSSISSMAR